MTNKWPAYTEIHYFVSEFYLISDRTFIIRKAFVFAPLVYFSFSSEAIDLEQKQILYQHRVIENHTQRSKHEVMILISYLVMVLQPATKHNL